MNKKLQAAIAERIELGWNKEQIIQELVNTGYTEAEASQSYAMVAETEAATHSAQVAPEATSSVAKRGATTASSMQADTVEKAASTEMSPISSEPKMSAVSTIDAREGRPLGLIIAGVSILFIGSALVYAVFMGWHRPLLSTIGFGSAPYDEVTLLPGVLLQSAKTDQAKVSSKFSLVLEEPDTSVPVGDDEFFEGLQMLLLFSGLGLPEEAHMKIKTEVTIDNRIGDDVEFDLRTEADLLFEPFTFRAGASLRRVAETLYGRVDRLPPVMLATLESEGIQVPTGQWVILPSTEEDFEQFFGPSLQPTLTPMPISPQGGGSSSGPQLFFDSAQRFILAGLNDYFWNSVTTFAGQVVAGTQTAPSAALTANLGQLVLDNLPDYFTTEEREHVSEAVDILAQAWRQYPLIEFVTDPYRISDNGESVYVYEIQPATYNIDPFLRQIITGIEASTLPGDEIDVEEIKEFLAVELDELITILETIEPFYDLRMHVRADGTLQALILDAAVRSGVDSFPHQFRLHMSSRYIAEEIVEDVAVPTDIYEKTLLEIIAESMYEAQQNARDAVAMQAISTVDFLAQMYYIENEFSFIGLCDSVDYVQTADSFAQEANVNIRCFSASDEYAFMTLLSGDEYSCVREYGPPFSIESQDATSAWQECSGQTEQS